MKQYDINELSSIVGVSKQSIYKLLSKDKDFTDQHTTKRKRKIYYDEAILLKLKDYYEIQVETSPIVEAVEAPVEAESDATSIAPPTEQELKIEALQRQIEALQKQLEESKGRIATLEAREQELVKQNGLALMLLQQEKQEKMLLLPPPKEEKRSLWQRITHKKQQ